MTHFTVSEEPTGDRVNLPNKLKRIESIVDALDPEEVEFLRSTPFGKIISQAEILHFPRVWLARQGPYSQNKEKYEIWFLFCQETG